MSAIFRAGISAWRGSPPLSPKPAKSKVKTVNPCAASARA
jgi:hypothetical protein